MYNAAHALAQAIKNSQEFGEYKHWHQIVIKDDKNKAMVEDYQKKVVMLQYAMMDGKEPDPKKLEELRNLEGILTANSTVKLYLEAQMRFSTVYSDIQKIITDALEIPEDTQESIEE